VLAAVFSVWTSPEDCNFHKERYVIFPRVANHIDCFPRRLEISENIHSHRQPDVARMSAQQTVAWRCAVYSLTSVLRLCYVRDVRYGGRWHRGPLPLFVGLGYTPNVLQREIIPTSVTTKLWGFSSCNCRSGGFPHVPLVPRSRCPRAHFKDPTQRIGYKFIHLTRLRVRDRCIHAHPCLVTKLVNK